MVFEPMAEYFGLIVSTFSAYWFRSYGPDPFNIAGQKACLIAGVCRPELRSRDSEDKILDFLSFFSTIFELYQTPPFELFDLI